MILPGLGIGFCSLSSPAQSDVSGSKASQVQYNYLLKAGRQAEACGVAFDKMVAATLTPISTRDGSQDMRINIYFVNCTFNGSLIIVGDCHPRIRFGAGCPFGDGSALTCHEATAGATEEAAREDNLIKYFPPAMALQQKQNLPLVF